MRVGRAPAEVAQYADGCARAVRRALGVPLDLAPETLPILDHYVERLADKPTKVADCPVGALVAVLAGAYFGEVVRQAFPSRWTTSGPEPIEWRIELRHCLLTFFPVGIAWEVILKRETPGVLASFMVEETERGAIADRLGTLPPAAVDEYYSFTQRFETLSLTAGWLVDRNRGAGDDAPARATRPTRAMYATLVESFRTR